jgi:carboxyl-terminal processing protease
MHTRETSLAFVLNPRAETYTGPLAVLVDGCSMSTTEILAGGLQDLGRARVFGTPTAGAALPSMVERLPNGDGFQYAFASYVSVGGEHLEGRGVRPDVVVSPVRESLLEGRDAVLDAAVDWILSEAAGHDRDAAPATSPATRND